MIQHMDVQQAQPRQFLSERQVLNLDVGERARAIEHAVGRQPDPDPVGINGGGGGTSDCKCEAITAVDAATVGVGALLLAS
jgi:hypothetical protein